MTYYQIINEAGQVLGEYSRKARWAPNPLTDRELRKAANDYMWHLRRFSGYTGHYQVIQIDKRQRRTVIFDTQKDEPK